MDLNPANVHHYIFAILIAFVLFSIATNLLETLTENDPWVHAFGILTAGLLFTIGLDPEETVLMELIDMTALLSSEFAVAVRVALMFGASMEAIFGFFYVLEGKGPAGLFILPFLAGSGLLIPVLPLIGVLVAAVSIIIFELLPTNRRW